MFHELLQLNCDDVWATWMDYIGTGIFISGGSEGFNSLLKFANYKKEASKADAANKLTTAGNAVQQVNPQK